MKYKNIILLFSILIFSLTCNETTLPKDCLGDEGGTAYLDECGVCDADSNNDNVTCFDCTGEINGIHIWDECNVCDIYSNFGGIKPSYPYGGPNGFCDCTGVLNGDAVEDYCGDCEGTCESNNPDSCERLDDCNVCDGDNSPNTGICDCVGVPAGGTVEDCAGVCAGDAVEDCAGVCEGPDTGDECGICDGTAATLGEPYCGGTPNTNCCDCEGVINGMAYEDGCGICDDDFLNDCVGCMDELACNYDSTATEPCDDCCNELDWLGVCGGTAISGCFDTDADNFWCTKDYEEISCESYFDNCEDECIEGSGTFAVFNNPCGSEIGNNSICDPPSCSDDSYADEITCIDNDENWSIHYLNTGCEVWGCVDETAVNYDSNANNCEDGTNSCCTYAEVSLSFGQITSSTIEIYMQNSEAVGGFQFDLTGGSVLSGSASGGSAELNGLMVSTSSSTVIGFSLTGSSIPIGSGLLTIVDASLVSKPICIDNIVISDASGGNLEVSSYLICNE